LIQIVENFRNQGCLGGISQPPLQSAKDSQLLWPRIKPLIL
jgi:hypothetical protein